MKSKQFISDELQIQMCYTQIDQRAKLSFIIILLFVENILIDIFVLIEIIILFSAICIIHRISSNVHWISDTMLFLLFYVDFHGIWWNIKSSNNRKIYKHMLISFWYRNHEVFAPQRAWRPLRVQAVDYRVVWILCFYYFRKLYE